MPLQVLAQATADSSAAAGVLVDLARTGRIPDQAWAALGDALGGKHLQFSRTMFDGTALAEPSASGAGDRPTAWKSYYIEWLNVRYEQDIVTAAWQPPKGTPTALTPLGELLLPLEGLVDATAERERLGKEVAKVQDELGKVRAKLDNPSFAGKVPSAVLEEHRQRERAWSDKLAQFQRMLDALG